MKIKNKHMITAAAIMGAAAAAAAAGAYLTTRLLVKTALDREEPKIMKSSGSRIAGSKKDSEFAEICNAAADRLKASEHEKVTITAHDGITLVGHFFPAENPKRIIIAFHGWRSSWNKDYSLIADFWHNNDCSVLYVEQRGQSESGGEYMGFGLIERYDCLDWVNFAICRCGNALPIYLAGISMGAATVLMAADLPFPPNVHGIAADCGFTSPKAIWEHVARNNLHISFRLRSIIADIICRHKINMASDEHSTIKALENTKIPILFFHGSDDHFVPVEMTYENYKACASPKKLLIVPGADHAMSYYIDKQSYENAYLEFWNDFDNIAPTDE